MALFKPDHDKVLAELVQKLEKIYGRDLLSVVLYGSAAAGDFHRKHSDLNVLCVLRELDLAMLEKAEPVAHWWRGMGNPAPLFLSAEEVKNSTDAFPIEFFDMRGQHRVLHGEDPVGGLTIDSSYHRVQVEHELRAKLLALRQRYLGIHRDQKAVARLMLDSIPSFSALFRHALILSGEQAPVRKREVAEAAGRRFGFDPAPILALLDVRQGTGKASQLETSDVFNSYYNSIRRVAEAVDGLGKKAEIR